MPNDTPNTSTDGVQGAELFQISPPDDMTTREFEFEKLVTDPQLRAILRSMFIEAVTEGVKNHCRFPLSAREAQQMRFLFDGFRELGDGDTHTGIGRLFENIKFMRDLRKVFKRTSESVGKWVILGILGVIASIIGLGVKASLN